MRTEFVVFVHYNLSNLANWEGDNFSTIVKVDIPDTLHESHQVFETKLIEHCHKPGNAVKLLNINVLSSKEIR